MIQKWGKDLNKCFSEKKKKKKDQKAQEKDVQHHYH